ncbi:MAG: sigma-54 dependent transcriptional regulator [Smithellaceae bacterium]|nr:sigma-54 dependent transcriptional regulator [Smithellaceae bacterium]
MEKVRVLIADEDKKNKVTLSRLLVSAESFVPVPETPPNNDQIMKFVGSSDCMLRIFESIQKVAKSDSTVVIYGESGTGKELVARAIHTNSDRRDFPLVAVNCGAIPEDLLESELFGHEKGAFTGAFRTRIGRFELAREGTIFLDEIGDMTLGLQVKLLRVIQERQFERIGGTKTISADVRIVAATNQDLEKAVAEKKFREDLFYRLNVIPLQVPPLRDRTEDIPELTNFFLARFCKLKRKELPRISEQAMMALLKYPWPGNVRELENMMEMLVVMNDEGVITPDLLPPRVHTTQMAAPSNMVDFTEAGCNLNELVSNFEKELIRKALRLSGGVKSQAAKMLMLNRTTLVEKLKRFNLTTS